MARTSMLEAVKIQARVVIPIVKALEAEIGKERVDREARDWISRHTSNGDPFRGLERPLRAVLGAVLPYGKLQGADPRSDDVRSDKSPEG